MKKIAILGASYTQKPLVIKAREMGLETHVFAWEKGNVVDDITDYFYSISTRKKDKILSVCKDINIDGIISIGSDVAVPTMCYIGNELGLVNNSVHSAKLATNKYAMREALASNDLPVPDFVKIKNKEELKHKSFAFPFMVKAVDRSGSRGVKLVNNIQEAVKAFENAKKVSFSGEVILEKYFGGKQFSFEMFSNNSKHYFIGLTEEFFSGAPQFVEIGDLMPGRLSKKNMDNALDLTKQALTALEIENGASHVEMRINSRGECCFIEIGARMGGGFRSDLVNISYDQDYLGDTIKNSLGIPVNIKPKEPKQFSFGRWLLNKKELQEFNKNKTNIDVVKLEIFHNSNKKIESSSDRLGYYISKSKQKPTQFLNSIEEKESSENN